jgi:hypothetical protein
MKKILVLVIMIVAMFFTGPLISQQPVSAAGACNDKDASFLGFPTWYRGLIKDNATCTLKGPDEIGGLGNYIWRIVLNVIDILMIAIGYISVGFIIYGGFQYLTSAGSADGAKKGKTTITNAVIGLVLSLVAVAIINLVFSLWS